MDLHHLSLKIQIQSKNHPTGLVLNKVFVKTYLSSRHFFCLTELGLRVFFSFVCVCWYILCDVLLIGIFYLGFIVDFMKSIHYKSRHNREKEKH